MNSMRGCPISFAFVIACATTPPVVQQVPEAPPIEAQPEQEEEPITRVRATLGEGVLHVELEMRVDWIPRGADGVELLFYDQAQFERAPRGFMEFLPQPWTGRFPTEDGVVRAIYDVRLEHHLA